MLHSEMTSHYVRANSQLHSPASGSPAKQRPRQRRRRVEDVGVSLKFRMLMTFCILMTMASFVIMIGYVASRSRPRRMRQGRHINHNKQVLTEIKDPVEAVAEEDNIPDDIPPVYDFDEKPFNSKETIKAQDEVYVCENKDHLLNSAHVILFTLLPQDIKSREGKIIRNTIQTWQKLLPQVRPILFVPPKMLNNQIHSRLVDTACQAGFDVLFMRDCVQDIHPILRNMFKTVYTLYDRATWFGYSNYRLLFDSSLNKGLTMVEKLPEILQKGNLIVGQSHNLEVGTESLSPDFTDLVDQGTIVQEMYYFDSNEEVVLNEEISYFFTSKYGFPWAKIPAHIAESDDTDKFLMWYTMKNTSIAAVDATEAIFTLRQHYNTELNKTYDFQLKAYNNALNVKHKYPQYYRKGLGTIKCLEYQLTNSNMPYYVLSKRQRKYIRRVTKHKPVSLTYYCRIVKIDNLAMVDPKGHVQGCNLARKDKERHEKDKSKN